MALYNPQGLICHKTQTTNHQHTLLDPNPKKCPGQLVGCHH